MAVDHNNPQSRDEEILIATIDGTEYNKNPQSRMEELLLELKEVIEEGGGGGGIRPIGVTTTPLYDGATTNPIQINGESYTAETGDMVTYQSTEFLFNINEVWQELGDVSIVLAIIDNIFADIAPAFDAIGTYAVDDYVIYNDQLYRCTTAHTGSWDENDFTATTISDEITDIADAVDEIKDGQNIDSFSDVETALADKVNKVDGKGLSTNDYNDTEKAAVADATSAISAMKDGSDIDSFGDVEVALLDKADISDLGTAAAKDSTNAVTSGSTDLVESGAVKDAIDSAVSRTYHHAGTKTVAQLTHDLLIAANEGNVYEITDSGTTTSDFMEGIGRPIKEGDNVGIARVSDGVYMFDLLSGFVDTTNFVQKSQTAGLLKNDGTVNTTIENTVDANTTAISGIKDGQRIDSFGDVEAWTSASTKSVTGNPITIADAAAVKAKALSVSIDPVQDLHGYDKPWVGGAGKNKLPLTAENLKSANTAGTWNDNTYTVNGLTFTILTDDGDNVVGIKVTGTASAQTVFRAGTYTPTTETSVKFNGITGTGSGSTYSINMQIGSAFAGEVYSGDSVAHTISANTAATYLCVLYSGYECPTAGLMFYPMIRLSTETDATFAPYTNLCPISGHTEVDVQRDGKNLFDYEHVTIDDYPNTSGTMQKGCELSVNTGHIYCVKVNADENLYLFSKSGDTVTLIGDISTERTFTVADNTIYYLRNATNISADNFRAKLQYVQLELGQTATPYVPYAGKTYTIALGDTIYGGTVDFDSGVMTVTKAIVDLGDFTWTVGNNGKVTATAAISGAVNPAYNRLKAQMVSDRYKVLPYYVNEQSGVDASGTEGSFAIMVSSGGTTFNYPFVHDSNLIGMSAAEVKTALTGAKILYELATPTELQLTPAQLELLKGTNTLTANGATISLTYQPDNLVGEVMEQVEPQIEDLQGQIDEIPRPLNYSTTEQNTGQKWIDGKDIYTITVALDNAISMAATEWGITPLSAVGIDTITSVVAKASKFVFGAVGAAIADGYVNLMNNSSASLSVDNFTIWYTKSTT